MSNTSTRLNDIVLEVIERSKKQKEIKPTWVAHAAYKKMDRTNRAPALVRFAAMEQLKQIARGALRKNFDPENESDRNQHELWPNLQTRYPVARKEGDDPVYAKLEVLTREDIEWNLKRLRSEAQSKLEHAHNLEDWARQRGLFRDAAS